MKFIHLTDMHLVPPGSTLEGLDPAERFRAAVTSINSDHRDSAFVVVTGDLANAGQREAYAILRSEMARLAMPVHLMVGNHDDPKVLVETIPELAELADADFQTVFRTEAGVFVLLNTWQSGTDVGGFPLARQMWLKAVLEAEYEPVFLFMHHPPFAVGMPGMDSLRLDEPAFWSVLQPHEKRIRHLFFGHLHRPVWGSWRGIPYSGMRGVNHQMALDLATPAPVFYSCPEPPAYGVVLISDDQVTVHMHEFENGHLWSRM